MIEIWEVFDTISRVLARAEKGVIKKEINKMLKQYNKNDKTFAAVIPKGRNRFEIVDVNRVSN